MKQLIKRILNYFLEEEEQINLPVSEVAKLMNEHNPILDDIPFKEVAAESKRVCIRSGLPEVRWKRLSGIEEWYYNTEEDFIFSHRQNEAGLIIDNRWVSTEPTNNHLFNKENWFYLGEWDDETND